MIAALFKRLQNFFAAFAQALGRAKIESAEEIFGKVERGELKGYKETQTMGERLSLLRKANPDEIEISTQNPQGVSRIYDPITEMLSIDTDAVKESMKANPDMGVRVIQAIKSYGFVPNGTPDEKVLEVFKNNIINNLMYLHNKVPKAIRQRSKLWYDGANKIATEMADNYDMSLRQVAAIMAAMSPQKDWFQNVSMAERAIDILTKHGDKAWSGDMLKYADSYVYETRDQKEREKRQDAFAKIKDVAKKGTKLKDMDEKSAAAFIRAYDESFHSRNYRIVTPEGGFGDLVRKLDGGPATMMWSTYGPIEKAVSIYRDGSRSNVSEQLGFEHKIRSFYNNIAAPNSDIDHVTIDTHAVAAGLFEALAGTDTEVTHNFGGTGKSDVIGVGGTYGLIADAYREAARRAGIQAREMQSITWEAVRGLFTEDIKSTIKPKIRAEWQKYKEGTQSFNETRENVVKIAGGFRDPDWVDSGAGQFVIDGGTSYDKAFIPEGGVRLRETKQLREKMTFNLSAVTNSIPGLRNLYALALKGDEKAYALLQNVAKSSLDHLLMGTKARVTVDFAKGVYLSDREPSISVSVAFDEDQNYAVMGALAKFAGNYNQQQIHVRAPTIRTVGHDFDDGSYATPVYNIALANDLSDEEISNIISKSGLNGFTITKEVSMVDKQPVTTNVLTAYWVQPNEIDEQFQSFDRFQEGVKAVNEMAGASRSKPKQRVERLYVYGEGYGARIPYSAIESDIRAKQGPDTTTPRLIAEYLTGEEVTAFKPKKLTKAQASDQELLALAFEDLPVNDLSNPLVKSAYEALNTELVKQYKAMPVKVEMASAKTPPYKNSAEMRADISENNRFQILKTTPSTFGPPGVSFEGHPLLEDSGLKDINGKRMLYNDVLRAVHDYFAHNITEAEFGPIGEAAAWRNHMATTPNPLARWALTAETRAQNAWQNFRKGVKSLTFEQRGYALQKAALPPVNFAMTGDAKVDAPMVAFINSLSNEDKLGSLPPTSKEAGVIKEKMPKLSLGKTSFATADEAEEAAYGKAPPQTPEFKLFYGASTLIDEGRPQVMYHGSDTDISTFYEDKPIFVTPDVGFAEDFASDRAKDNDKDPSEVRIYPLWVRAETPFDYENTDHVEQIMQRLITDQNATKPDSTLRLRKSTNVPVDKLRSEIKRGLWSVIEDKTVQDIIKSLGFDSFTVYEGGKKNLAVYSAAQVKSVTGNIGEFGREAKDIRFSLPKVSKQVADRVNATTTTREVKGFAERITDAISPKARSYFRAKALNRYNQLGVYDRKLAEKMGGAAFLADTSAEAGALFSDLGAGVTASALGFGDRHGGIPVYKNGVTTVDRSVKGLVASLAPLAQYGDPKVYQYYQYWAAVKRGTRLLEGGRERLIDKGDIALAAELEKKFPEFVQVQKDYTAFNNGVVKYMVDTGVLSQERGNEYMKYADYVPFYRQADGETTIGPNIFQAISGVKPPKKLKGSEAPLADFLETIVRNTQASIQAGMKNAAAQRAVNVASQISEPGMGAVRLDTKQSGPDILNVLEKGEQVSYRTPDSLLVDAIGSLHMPDIPFIGILSAPSDLLRNLVTKDPGFMMANLMRDSLSAWVTSGQKMTPIAGTVINFGKALAGKSPGMEALMDAGIIGGYEFSANVESSGAKLSQDLLRKSGKEGKAAPLRAARWVWEALEKGTTASDAATRALVYERVMQETGNEAEALYRSLEVMNFNRKGSSPVIRVLTAAVPFFNARLQGLDLFYRAAWGKMNMQDAKGIQKAFWTRGAMMMGLTAVYWFLTHDDEEYKKQEQETRDNNWLLPSIGVKIPTPFEVGVLFKTVPERILEYTFGDDTGKDFAKSMGHAMLSTFAFNPIPQTVKPIIEVATNRNFFTMRPMIGQGMEDIAAQYQVGPSTSKTFEEFGRITGLSPIQVEHLYKGYTGTMGMYLVDVVDSILNANSNSPNATKRFEQLPVIKRFALDKEARGTITQYYELKRAVDSTVKTMNMLEKTAKPAEFAAFVQENKGYLATKDYVRDLEKEMKELREMRSLVRSSTLSGDQKRDANKTLTNAENNLTANIQTVKTVIASMK